jgi:hypothetical protein
MAGTKLDGAGTQKMKTIEEALITLQKIHGLVERMGVEVAANRPSVMFPAQVKRMATPLQGFLKGQFGLIADQVTALILATGRGGGEKLKLRVMRETVAQIRTALEMAASKVKTQHAVQIETAGGD